MKLVPYSNKNINNIISRLSWSVFSVNLRMRNSGKLVLSIFCVYITWSVETVVSQECRSYNRQVGHCVSILTCPPLLRILRMSPTVHELRQLQRLTCGFDGSDPKVCCPTNSIFPPLESTSDRISGSPSDTESSSPMTPVTSTTKTASTEAPTSDIASDLTRPDLKSHPKFNLIPTLKECSEVFVTGDRVVGGKEVAHGTYPWMARVGYQHSVTKKLTYYCGGNIINNRYILTAAHCTEGLEEYTPKEVRLGENDSSQESNCNAEYNLCSKAEDFQIEKIISHPGYSTITKQNDISLIRVNRNISFDSYFIQPLCLPFDKEYGIENFTLPLGVDGAKAVVAGWGRTVANKNKGSDKLLEVTLPVKTNKECQSIFSRRVTISSKQICAGGETGMDSCGGDSGGPLVGFKTVNNEIRRTKFFQVGIVSFGPVNCGVGGLPGVYTRVSHYLDWILDTIEP